MFYKNIFALCLDCNRYLVTKFIKLCSKGFLTIRNNVTMLSIYIQINISYLVIFAITLNECVSTEGLFIISLN